MHLDLVATIFGSGTVAATAIYVLVALSGFYVLYRALVPASGAHKEM
jgi:uncharacterized membrane protein YuzA (DUF378 family)